MSFLFILLIVYIAQISFALVHLAIGAFESKSELIERLMPWYLIKIMIEEFQQLK